MTVEEFVKEVLEQNREELDEVRKLQEIMDQLAREETEIYVLSVESNL